MCATRFQKEAVLRVGEVSAVTGRRIFVSVDTEKNLSGLFFNGDVLPNIAVGGYVDIRKGFISLIGKVEGENAHGDGDKRAFLISTKDSQRILVVSLVGFIDRSSQFHGGTKELPLVGNEAFLLTKERVHQIHNLVQTDGIALDIAKSEYEGYEIALPVDGLMNSHIAIFGNTGSGKSNTLAILYQNFIAQLQDRNRDYFEKNCKIVLFDFNGEYTRENCLTVDKVVFNLSTRGDNGDKLPLGQDALLNIEILSILAAATEKTQRPFLSRTLTLRKNVLESDNPREYLQNIVRKQIERTFQSAEKAKGELLFDYFSQVLPSNLNTDGTEEHIASDIQFHTGVETYKLRTSGLFLDSNIDSIPETIAYKRVEQLDFNDDMLFDFIMFMYIRLIYDILDDRARNEHIAPVIYRLQSKQIDISKIFNTKAKTAEFDKNVIIISLNDVNIEMKKMVPLLISKKIYQDHKQFGGEKSLSIVIDEAHNILSNVSFRESESWKDYRLETFEEIIKEGRKFGVFVTIASQRPSDISPTITSQAHNYFIHRLVNERDLKSISSVVSYIDRLTEESIPTLQIGTCIFSGVAGQMPLKLVINELKEELRPHSTTLKFSDIV